MFEGFFCGDQGRSLDKCSQAEYKKLNKICISQRRVSRSEQGERNKGYGSSGSEQNCHCDVCPACDQKFFDELAKETSDIAGCFSSRMRRLLHFDIRGLGPFHKPYSYMRRLSQLDDQETLVHEVRFLLDLVTKKAAAIRMVLNKYGNKALGLDSSTNYMKVLKAKCVQRINSPWLIELGAFYLNFSGSDANELSELFKEFSCDLTGGTQPAMRMILSDSTTYEYNFICPICLDTVFNPYALGCGHYFCKSCVCAAASVPISDGPRSAPTGAKCPVCRVTGVYRDPVHMLELDHLLRNRCKYWKDRLREERAEMMKLAKQNWEKQTLTALGYH